MRFLKVKSILFLMLCLCLSLFLLSSCGDEPTLDEGIGNGGGAVEPDEPESPSTDEPEDKPDSPTPEEPLEPEVKIEAEKLISHADGKTVYPGEVITYTFKIKNLGESVAHVKITDTVAKNTEYLDGASEIDGDAITINTAVGVGATKKVSYTVRVKSDMELCNGAMVESTVALVNGAEVSAGDVYIERTLNSADVKYIDYAIDALSDSNYSDVTLIKWIYTVAFSQTSVISNNFLTTAKETAEAILSGTASEMLLDMVAPGLYGGADVTSIEGVKGAPLGAVDESALIIGDVLICLSDDVAFAYIYGSEGLWSLESGCVRVDTGALLSSLSGKDGYVVIRPSAGLVNFTPTDLSRGPDELNEKQLAIVETAKYYLNRGEWLQYDDTYYAVSLSGIANESRWEVAMKTPEESTSQKFGYINCAAFTHDVYWTVFGKKLPSSMYTTKNLTSGSLINNMRMFNFTRTAGQAHAEEEMAKVKSDFWNTIEPGDIMVILRGSYGHAMLYIGDGVFIHSSGSSYNYANSAGIGEEKYEPTIRYHRVNDYFFDETSTNGYVFGEKVTSFSIVRPLNNTDWNSYEITDVAKARIENLKGIIAQKLPSLNPNVSVNPGEEITYTFSVNNTNKNAVTVKITDKIPEGTEYVLGGDKLVGNTVYFNLTVPARTTLTVSYTVRVKDGTPYGTEITAKDAVINGVPLMTYSTVVRRTLTSEEQERFIEAFAEIKSGGTYLRGVALINELYKQVIGANSVFKDFDVESIAIGKDGIFTSKGMPISSDKQSYTLNFGTYYCNMVAQGLYGGRRLSTVDVLDLRTELALKEHLVVGDVLVGKTLSSYVIYLYVGGDNFISLSSLSPDTNTVEARLERLPGYGYFYAIIRPSYSQE